MHLKMNWLICSPVSLAPNKRHINVHRPDWTQEPLFQHNAGNWKTLVYFVIGAGNLEATVFHGENRSFPKSFWQKRPLLWLASRNNPWLCGKYCEGHSAKFNISESNNTSIYLKNRCGRTLEQNRFGCVVFYLWACTGTRIQVGGNGYIGTTTDHYTLQSSIFKAYLAYQSCCRDHARPWPPPPPPLPPPPPCVCASVSGTAGWNVWRSIAKCHK